jgi:hypothetical protein
VWIFCYCCKGGAKANANANVNVVINQPAQQPVQQAAPQTQLPVAKPAEIHFTNISNVYPTAPPVAQAENIIVPTAEHCKV